MGIDSRLNLTQKGFTLAGIAIYTKVVDEGGVVNSNIGLGQAFYTHTK